MAGRQLGVRATSASRISWWEEGLTLRVGHKPAAEGTARRSWLEPSASGGLKGDSGPGLVWKVTLAVQGRSWGR